MPPPSAPCRSCSSQRPIELYFAIEIIHISRNQKNPKINLVALSENANELQIYLCFGRRKGCRGQSSRGNAAPVSPHLAPLQPGRLTDALDHKRDGRHPGWTDLDSPGTRDTVVRVAAEVTCSTVPGGQALQPVNCPLRNARHLGRMFSR